MNGTIDQRIVYGGLVIVLFGVFEATQERKPLTPVIEGSIMVMLIASLAAAFAPATVGKVAAGLVLLAASGVAISELPSIASMLGANGKKTGEESLLPDEPAPA